LKYLTCYSNGKIQYSDQKNRAKQNNSKDTTSIEGAETRFNNYAKKYFDKHKEKPTFEQQIKKNGPINFVRKQFENSKLTQDELDPTDSDISTSTFRVRSGLL
jgi:hypothetical protein